MINKIKKMGLGQFALFLTIGTLVVRLLTLGVYPLMDTTEARYGEMSRIMFETGNWVTPMFDYAIPFWGKPPIFTWLSASGSSLMGVNEFAARVPHLFVGVMILVLCWWFAYRVSSDRKDAWLTTAILSSMVAFIVISGSVMTDTALTFAITLTMVSFWLNWEKRSALWGNLFFVGLAIGMLSKGPLTIVLVGISLVLWLAFSGHWREAITSLPWKSGIALFLVISLPWYLLAEYKTPGFLNYFIIGEHIQRFVVSGWEGDLYGSAHKEVRGTIWLYWFVAALPWTPVFFYQLIKKAKRRDPQVSIKDDYVSYLWCWMLATLILFTFAGNILASYVMPGLPALALLIVRNQKHSPVSFSLFKVGLITPVLLVLAAIALNQGLTGKEAEKGLMSIWQQQPEREQSALIYVNKRPFSAQYYSEGKAVLSKDPLNTILLSNDEAMFLVVKKSEVPVGFLWNKTRCELRGQSQKRELVYCSSNRTMPANSVLANSEANLNQQEDRVGGS